MKTLYCDYFVPKSLPTPAGVHWGAIAIKNRSNEQQNCVVTVYDFETNKVIKTIPITLKGKEGKLLTNTNELLGIVGRTTIEIDCSDYVTAMVGTSRGTENLVVYTPMQILSYPKS